MAIVADPELLRELMFEPADLHRLVNGVDQIEVEEVRGFTKYKPPFTDAHRVRCTWAVVVGIRYTRAVVDTLPLGGGPVGGRAQRITPRPKVPTVNKSNY